MLIWFGKGTLCRKQFNCKHSEIWVSILRFSVLTYREQYSLHFSPHELNSCDPQFWKFLCEFFQSSEMLLSFLPLYPHWFMEGKILTGDNSYYDLFGDQCYFMWFQLREAAPATCAIRHLIIKVPYRIERFSQIFFQLARQTRKKCSAVSYLIEGGNQNVKNHCSLSNTNNHLSYFSADSPAADEVPQSLKVIDRIRRRWYP